MLSERVPAAVVLALFGAGLLVMIAFEFANPPVDWLNVLIGAAFLPIFIVGSYSWLAWFGRRRTGTR